MDAKKEGRKKQHIDKRTGKHSKIKSKRKGRQENVQNPKRSVARYRNRESGYV